MRRIALLFILLLVSGILTVGCNGPILMSETDKQPKVSCTAYAVSPASPATGGVVSPSQDYGMRQLVAKDGVTELARQALNPVTITRFELSIETYNINQGFTFYVEFPPPPSGFPVTAFTIVLPMENAVKIPESDNGRGPGGLVIVPVAIWGPGNAPPNAVGMSPAGEYEFKFVATDSDGRDAVCYETITVNEKIVEKVKVT